MKKRMISLPLVATLVVLIVVYAAMTLAGGRQADGLWFHFGSREQIETIHIENPYGQFDFYQKDGVWMVKSGGEFRTNELKMQMLCDSLKQFRVKRVLEEENPAYGLGKGIARVQFTTSKGAEYALCIGNTTMSASDCYVKDLKDGQIFVTDGASVAQLIGSIAAYRYKEVFTVDKNNITKIRYSEGGKHTITLELDKETGWWITEPYDRVPARAIEMDEFLTQIRAWTVAGYVDMNRVDANAIGLNETADVLEVTDAQGNTQTLTFGSSTQTNTCVRIGEANDVVLLYSTDVDLSVLDPDKMLFIAPLKTSIDQVASIQVSVSGADYVFTIEEDTGLVKCNGVYVDEDAFAGIFFRYISMIASGADPEHTVAPKEPVAYFKTVLRDGSETAMTVFGRDQGTCYMEVEGETIYYLDTAKIVDLVERIEAAVGTEEAA